MLPAISTSAGGLPSLKVTPNSVAINYKGQAADFQKIDKSLGMDTVLSGRVVQRGEDLPINIELDDVNSGKQVWESSMLTRSQIGCKCKMISQGKFPRSCALNSLRPIGSGSR
jgi:hypothetical protein